ncbi:MAG: hypothetical protein HZA48_07215 [Planctomycetes bacterium]|nr:hypothetical protein [Planctomycetota bacterium]
MNKERNSWKPVYAINSAIARRIVLSLFSGKDRIIASDVVQALGLSSRMARILLQKWVKDGWLVVADAANRSRSYGLSAIYRKFNGKVKPLAVNLILSGLKCF